MTLSDFFYMFDIYSSVSVYFNFICFYCHKLFCHMTLLYIKKNMWCFCEKVFLFYLIFLWMVKYYQIFFNLLQL